MKTENRKAATTAYKERKLIMGIYAIRCLMSGTAWIGQSTTLDTIQNRLWFTLRLGNHPCRELQQAWNDNGAENFTFEELERLDNEDLVYVRDARLKERALYWRSLLGGLAI
ncbi:GIY-YIG nuclease family protein [Phyllobacterium sp. OV277]|jgi:hypothetical protein|uniref:GIY-YIG nuclease family protein n=1 Tax=Phyllobacterium sp. OV277 TaxID=1882772 RepID=UPI000880BC9C|nr:GIY-YIG nuclease family protein [Phyllobacterium sp. OV277]SDP27468.1 hypothetical protein SAMN05443582_10466 [Phyllobacterium sp. OV277]